MAFFLKTREHVYANVQRCVQGQSPRSVKAVCLGRDVPARLLTVWPAGFSSPLGQLIGQSGSTGGPMGPRGLHPQQRLASITLILAPPLHRLSPIIYFLASSSSSLKCCTVTVVQLCLPLCSSSFYSFLFSSSTLLMLINFPPFSQLLHHLFILSSVLLCCCTLGRSVDP